MNLLHRSLLLAASSFFLALIVPAGAFAANYALDADHTQVTFKVRHLGISSVSGQFKNLSGSFTFDPKNIAASKAEATIKSESVDTLHAKRDEHLRSPDFLNSAQHPEIKFITKEIKDVKGNNFTVTGDLTLHGVTKPVELEAEFLGETKDPWGKERAGFAATARINRKDFGLTWNKVLETGGLVVGDEVKIELSVEGIKQ